MNPAIAISINNISKAYTLSLPDTTHQTQVKALDGISLQIKKGERWGIIGKNGSGKSTLLALLASIIKPSEGTVEIHGTLSQILDIGSNFIPELTGRENVKMFFKLYGFSKQDTDKLLKEVISFADIGNYIDAPVKKYSNGMFLRLAFASSIQLKADIILVDEVFSTGDVSFREKLKKFFAEKFNSPITVLLASHNPDEIMEFCTHCIWLEKGKVKMQGTVKEIMEGYYFQMAKENSIANNLEQFVVNKPDHILEKKVADFENTFLKISNFSIAPNLLENAISYESGVCFNIEITKKTNNVTLHPQIVITDYKQRAIMTLFPTLGSKVDLENYDLKNFTGNLTYRVSLPPFILTYGHFYAELRFGKDVGLNKDFNEEGGRLPQKLFFEVEKSDTNEYIGRTENVFIRPACIWEVTSL